MDVRSDIDRCLVWHDLVRTCSMARFSKGICARISAPKRSASAYTCTYGVLSIAWRGGVRESNTLR